MQLKLNRKLFWTIKNIYENLDVNKVKAEACCVIAAIKSL